MSPDQHATSATVPPDTSQRDHRLSRTACEHCRRQKLRCSREHPICARCKRHSLLCHYPQPVNRKLLAARRGAGRTDSDIQGSKQSATRAPGYIPGTEKLSATHNEASNAQEHLSASPPRVRSIRNSSQVSDCNYRLVDSPSASTDVLDTAAGIGTHLSQAGLSPFINSACTALKNLPPRSIGLGLLDIYFDRLYNAHLLFHRAKLFEAYIDGKVPSYLLRAIFALASLFLRRPSQLSPRLRYSSQPDELTAFAAYAKNGYTWAVCASQDVLPLADQPCLETVQTFQCLSLYWFSVGDMDRARIHSAIAYTSCSSFRACTPAEDGPTDPATMLNEERKLCCFWACWASMCISALPDAYARNAWGEAFDVPLPMPSDWLNSLYDPHHTERMDRRWNCISKASLTNSRSPKIQTSIMGEFMKMIGIWARIQVLTRDNTTDLVEIENLSAAADRLYHSDTFPSFASLVTVASEDNARLLGLHSIYHLCQMVLLCPLISLFSGRQLSPAPSRESTRSYAETITRHAINHGQLIRQYINRACDVTKLSPLVGFSSFVATSILVSLVKSETRRHRNRQSGRMQISSRMLDLVKGSLDVLDVLEVFWVPLRPMATQLRNSAEDVLKLSCDPSHSTPDNLDLIEMPITAVNSPRLDQEDVISTTYVEAPQYPRKQMGTHGQGQQPCYSNDNIHVIVDDRHNPRIFQAEADENVVLNWEQQHDRLTLHELGLLPVLSGEIPSLDNIADWNFDFLSSYPM